MKKGKNSRILKMMIANNNSKNKHNRLIVVIKETTFKIILEAIPGFLTHRSSINKYDEIVKVLKLIYYEGEKITNACDKFSGISYDTITRSLIKAADSILKEALEMMHAPKDIKITPKSLHESGVVIRGAEELGVGLDMFCLQNGLLAI